nr:uncharacterized protein LOC116774166 [Danaus plexippus plexippus]
MLTNEAHKLKIVLHDMLLDERGSVHTHDIKRFIDYVDARPFRLRICNLIPLDYKYPLIIINVYVTYTIVIAQFSRDGGSYVGFTGQKGSCYPLKYQRSLSSPPGGSTRESLKACIRDDPAAGRERPPPPRADSTTFFEGSPSRFVKNLIKVIFYIEAVFILLLPLVPSFFAELIRFEISKIKTHLKKQLLVCSGEFSRNKILDALTFLRLNPFVFSVWRLFNVDITLPLTLVSVCTTYIIVLIQLKQLY